MRSKRDARISRQSKQKAPSPPGGKVLRRLFTYLAERDPALGKNVVDTLVIPNASIPRFVLPKGLSAERAERTLAEPQARGVALPTAKAFATKISQAATALSRARGLRRRALPATHRAAPAGALPQWEAIGPSIIPDGQTYGDNRIEVIGRVSSIAVDPENAKHILLGAAGGGIWESKDAGANWLPRTDAMPSLAIGAIAFDPANSKRVYAGSGEGNFYADLGVGVYL
jgi:hypothetical protein